MAETVLAASPHPSGIGR